LLDAVFGCVEAMQVQHVPVVAIEEHLELIATVARAESERCLVPAPRRVDIAHLQHRPKPHNYDRTLMEAESLHRAEHAAD
jgi:hypothetical protein